ncbi:hypothetical protein KKF91_07875 [Myxococcota bacterium]|nr:hypothetical protein [Myxococcota bacterium]MBU1430462.1 hypothetical protein [Myxococcota bacterium]MBU1898671.1 hypothetical protein [Myxococcota bacterium]
MSRSLDALGVWFGFHLDRRMRTRPLKLWGLVMIGVVGGLIWAERGAQDTLNRLTLLILSPLMSLTFCVGVVREEIEDQTLTYGFTRPVARGWLYVARVFASVAPVVLITLPAALIAGGRLGLLLPTAAAALLAALAYGGVFALVGQLVKWPAWLGLIFILGWEYWVSQVPGFLGRLTLLSDVRAIADLKPEIPGLLSFWEAPSLGVSALRLLIVAVVTLGVGARLVQRREHALSK